MNDDQPDSRLCQPQLSLRQRLSRDEFIELHHRQCLSQKAIAERFDISIAYVIRLRKQYNIPLNTKVQKDITAVKKTRVSLEAQTNPEEIRRLYRQENMSCDGIAQRFNVSRKTVWKYLGRHGIDARDKTEARRNAITEGRIKQVLYRINEDFFKTWSPAMAWVLGLIVTDGNIGVGPSGMLVPDLSSVSLSLLEKVRECMASNHPIKLVNQTLGGTIYRFTFCRRKLAEDLVALGVTPKKSLTIQFPPVPAPFLSHFIRGVFDGDGSVFREPRSPTSPLRVFFVSGSTRFITILEDKLHSEAGLRKQTIYSRQKMTSFYFKYGHEDSLKFFNFIYTGADESIRFEEKHQKFLNSMRSSGMLESAIAMKLLSLQTAMPAPPQPVLTPSISAIQRQKETSAPSSQKTSRVNFNVNSLSAPRREAGKFKRFRFKVTLNGVIVYAGWLISNSDTHDSFIRYSCSCQIISSDVDCVEECIKAGRNNITIDDRNYQVEIKKRFD